MDKKKNRSPWSWIPTLYMAEGLPYVAVMTISVIMYKRMGISNTDIALYTSWLYFPWVIKPFWSPFVDLLRTKFWWITTMQLLVGAGFAGVAFSIPVPFFFQATLAFFWLLAFSSATHDIAADGFYMIALDAQAQAKFVGIRSTFYRLSTILGQGLLIILAGFIESNTGMKPIDIRIDASPAYIHSAPALPLVTTSSDKSNTLHLVTSGTNISLSTNPLHRDSARLMLQKAGILNQSNGFVRPAAKKTGGGNSPDGFWGKYVSSPLGNWIKTHFGENRGALLPENSAGNLAFVAVRLSAPPTNDKTLSVSTQLQNGDASISLVEGERLTFDQTNWNKTAYLVFQLDPKLKKTVSAVYRSTSGNIPFAWTTTFLVLAALFILMSFYHRRVLPDVGENASTKRASAIMTDFWQTVSAFTHKPHIWRAVFFILTFRFSEAQVLKLINPFLLDAHEVGGLGLTTGEVGLAYGTVGIIGLTIGGIIGGFAAAKGGLRKWLWPMTLSMLLTILTFVFLSYSQTHNLFIINACVFIEQFGYGFGFTAFMLFLIYFSDGEHKTAHYAFCTGLMALGMMVPGMFAGWLQELLGYRHFFVWTMICSIVPIVAVALVKIEEE